MDTQQYIAENISDLYDDSECVISDINDLNSQINILKDRLFNKRTILKGNVATLLCLVTINRIVHGALLNKIPLIKLHRYAWDSGLKEAKEAVEEYTNILPSGLKGRDA